MLSMVTCQNWADPHDESRNRKHTQSSFPEIHKDGKVGISYIAYIWKYDGLKNQSFNFNSKHYEKCLFALKLIRLLTVYNLFQ